MCLIGTERRFIDFLKTINAKMIFIHSYLCSFLKKIFTVLGDFSLDLIFEQTLNLVILYLHEPRGHKTFYNEKFKLYTKNIKSNN